MSEMLELTTEVGRLVSGHPMERNQILDDVTKQPKLQVDGTQRSQIFVALAIPKQPGVDWKATLWGQQIVKVGVEAWPAGESLAPTFAWKVSDGDSAIPNKNGRKPCDNVGYPGHWIIKASTELTIKCFHVGQYEPHQVIQNAKEIKRGDWARLVLNVKGNNPSKSPGVYVNPMLFELQRAGEEIVVDFGPSAEATFGATPGVLPPGAVVDPNIPAAGAAPPIPGAQRVAAPAPPPPAMPSVPPAHDFLAPIVMRVVNGIEYPETSLRAQGWTEAQIAAAPLPTVPF